MHIAPVTGGCSCDTLSDATEMMSLSDALDRALAQVAPIPDIHTVALAQSYGRTTAKAVCAAEAMPFFDNSAMDGFALRCADLVGVNRLPIAGTVSAGDSPRALPQGTALRIFTGALLPQGADAVVMVERSHEAQGHVSFTTIPSVGDNIRRAGSDQSAGQKLLAAGTRIGAHHIGLLAANGIEHVDVIRRPCVAVFSTGDELRSGQRKLGQIPDANRPMLLALASAAGADVTDLGILPDDAEATARALKNLGAHYDLILTSGAVSLGGKDHIIEALVAAGGTVQGWRVALKPGKPVMFGKLGYAAFTGLPGNPFAVHVGFHMFVLPQIARMLGAKPAPFAPVPAVAGFDWSRKAGRAEVFPVRLAAYTASGLPVLERLGHSVSATLLPLGKADGLAIVPADCREISTGASLYWRPFCLSGEQK
ncbi:molybdopterin molybdotransferase MoeA [Pseudorhodobacter turbinis]|uniref:Molybdopterin molybdenumtransferase n=1 Tax=Pseudorhodobacter turbinis TaxID=2500533 RepID=A0A4P8EGD5_9RHOB|nr:gephyrin-like molybdotransferase Glp [Pseudorhodobacter turbinis]QCO55585.1 molybdopterin molybdotransferase MoeA [Pseudorhodobacter turbinis]